MHRMTRSDFESSLSIAYKQNSAPPNFSLLAEILNLDALQRPKPGEAPEKRREQMILTAADASIPDLLFVACLEGRASLLHTRPQLRQRISSKNTRELCHAIFG